jgi:branched-chain amino acid transport system substrate-binding protein
MPVRIAPTLFVIAFAACGLLIPAPPMDDGETITIVSSLPRTGSARGQTDTIVEGIRLAISEVDETIVLSGTTYRLRYLDMDDATAAAGQWTAEQERANANLAIKDPNVMIYIGTYNSGAAKQSMPMLNRANILMVSPANTSSELTKPNYGARDEPYKRYRPSGGVNYVRVVPTDDLQGPAGADWANDAGWKKVYILDDNEAYGKGIATRFEERAREIGLNVLGRETIDFKSQEFSALMTKIKRLDPDLIYFGGTTQTKAGQVAKDMVKAGMNRCKMMGPDGTYEQAMIDSAGAEVLNGRFFCTFCGLTPEKMTDTPGGKKFVDDFTRFYNRPPSEAYALYGYECGRVALAALRTANVKDRAAICKAGRELRDFPGVIAPFSFDENGDTTLMDMSGIAVEDGKFVFSKTLKIKK